VTRDRSRGAGEVDGGRWFHAPLIMTTGCRGVPRPMVWGTVTEMSHVISITYCVP
jgi:hypothetical protein